MKASELRIGNLLELPNKQAVQISIDSLKEIESGIHPYQKIPLTEDWLVRFGFIKMINPNNRIYYSLADYRAEIIGYRKEYVMLGEIHFEWVFYLTDSNGDRIGKEHNSVHQLQNLYFLLTGKELIK